MKIWRDITQPPSSDYLWYRLNKEKEFVGYFSYKGSKWVFVTRKELKSLKIEESSKKIINSIVDGAPEAYDTLKEIADKLEDLDYQDGQKVYHVATSEIQNPQEGDITVISDTVEFTYTDIGNPMIGWDYLYKEFDKIWLTVTSDYNGNSTLNNTGRVNFYFNGEDSIVVAYAETDSNNNVVLYLPDGTPVPNNELYLENIDSAYTLNVNSQGQTGLGQYITAKLVDKGGVKEYINGEWVDRASGGSGGSADNAVLYVNQTLTDNQKTQARTNINAQEKIDSNHKLDYGLLSNIPNSLVCTYMDFFDPAFTPGPDNPKEGDTVVSGEATNAEIYDSPLPHTYFAQNTAVIRVSLRNGKTINTCSASKSDGTSEVLTQSDLPKTFAPGEISAVTCDPGNAILVEQTVFTYHEYRGGRWVARKDVPYDAVKYTTQSLSTSQKTQARTNIGAGTYSKPNTGIPASDLASGVIPTVPALSTNIAADRNSDTKTATPKSVADYVDAQSIGIPVANAIPANGMMANVHYELGTLTGNVSITIDSTSEVAGMMNIYSLSFVAGSTAPTITFPSSITGWAGNCIDSIVHGPIITAEKAYEFTLEGNLAVINEFII